MTTLSSEEYVSKFPTIFVAANLIESEADVGTNSVEATVRVLSKLSIEELEKVETFLKSATPEQLKEICCGEEQEAKKVLRKIQKSLGNLYPSMNVKVDNILNEIFDELIIKEGAFEEVMTRLEEE